MEVCKTRLKWHGASDTAFSQLFRIRKFQRIRRQTKCGEHIPPLRAQCRRLFLEISLTASGPFSDLKLWAKAISNENYVKEMSVKSRYCKTKKLTFDKNFDILVD